MLRVSPRSPSLKTYANLDCVLDKNTIVVVPKNGGVPGPLGPLSDPPPGEDYSTIVYGYSNGVVRYGV